MNNQDGSYRHGGLEATPSYVRSREEVQRMNADREHETRMHRLDKRLGGNAVRLSEVVRAIPESLDRRLGGAA